MGVYIKGMEMPTGCSGCPIDSDICTLWQELPPERLRDTRPAKCPLVPVPPHGDLIDRDALKKQGYFFPCATGSEYAIPLRALREAPAKAGRGGRVMSKCGDCGNTLPALDGFSKKVFCKHYKLHMSNKADASRCDYFEKKPITHFDEIKAMSVEELAEWRSNGQCPPDHYHGDYDCLNRSCKGCWLDWLRQAGE